MSGHTVWIINHYAQLPAGSGGTRHFDLARHLHDLGWKSWIFAASVELNTQRQRLEKHEHARSESVDGVNFRWVNTPGYEGNGPGRIINMIVFSWKMLARKTTAGLERPALIIGSTVHPLAAAAAALLAKRYRVPFIFEVRDIWPETLIALGHTRRYGPVAILLGMLEKWLCRQSCRVVSVLPGYADYVMERKIRAPEVVHIPNGINLEHIGKVYPFEKPDTFRLTYLGAHGTANDLHTLVRAMELIELSHGVASIECHLIGSGPMKQALVDYCAARGLKQVIFHAPVSKSRIAATAADTEAFVLCGRKLPSLYKYGISMNKIPDYMAMGRPVIIALESANNPILEAQAGICVRPESPEELAEAIIGMAGMNVAELRGMGQRGRQYIEQKQNMKTLAKTLADVMDRCLAA